MNSLNLSDSGTYSCQVLANSDPVPIASVHTNIIVQRRPNTIAPEVQIVSVVNHDGRNPFVKCAAKLGHPTPQLEWRRKDGEILSKRIIVNGGLLHIQDAGKGEYGVYECVGRNEAGESIVEFNFVKS